MKYDIKISESGSNGKSYKSPVNLMSNHKMIAAVEIYNKAKRVDMKELFKTMIDKGYFIKIERRLSGISKVTSVEEMADRIEQIINKEIEEAIIEEIGNFIKSSHINGDEMVKISINKDIEFKSDLTDGEQQLIDSIMDLKRKRFNEKENIEINIGKYLNDEKMLFSYKGKLYDRPTKSLW